MLKLVTWEKLAGTDLRFGVVPAIACFSTGQTESARVSSMVVALRPASSVGALFGGFMYWISGFHQAPRTNYIEREEIEQDNM